MGDFLNIWGGVDFDDGDFAFFFKKLEGRKLVFVENLDAGGESFWGGVISVCAGLGLGASDGSFFIEGENDDCPLAILGLHDFFKEGFLGEGANGNIKNKMTIGGVIGKKVVNDDGEIFGGLRESLFA